LKTGEISKRLSSEWKTMSDAEKQFYLDKAGVLKRDFNLRHPDYVYRRRPNHQGRRRRSSSSGSNSESPSPGRSLSFSSPTSQHPSRRTSSSESSNDESPYLHHPIIQHSPLSSPSWPNDWSSHNAGWRRQAYGSFQSNPGPVGGHHGNYYYGNAHGQNSSYIDPDHQGNDSQNSSGAYLLTAPGQHGRHSSTESR